MDGEEIQLVDHLVECEQLVLMETPNNTSAAGGIGGCGIILDAGAAENSLRR